MVDFNHWLMSITIIHIILIFSMLYKLDIIIVKINIDIIQFYPIKYICLSELTLFIRLRQVINFELDLVEC